MVEIKTAFETISIASAKIIIDHFDNFDLFLEFTLKKHQDLQITIELFKLFHLNFSLLIFGQLQ